MVIISGWDRFTTLGHPCKFQGVSHVGFVTAATSLNGCQPNFARCLAVSWTGRLYRPIHFWELLPPNGILPGAKCTLRPSLAFSYIGSVTAQHANSWPQPSFAAFSTGRHLYSEGRPSRWASGHILVVTGWKQAQSCVTSIGYRYGDDFTVNSLVLQWTYIRTAVQMKTDGCDTVKDSNLHDCNQRMPLDDTECR